MVAGTQAVEEEARTHKSQAEEYKQTRYSPGRCNPDPNIPGLEKVDPEELLSGQIFPEISELPTAKEPAAKKPAAMERRQAET